MLRTPRPPGRRPTKRDDDYSIDAASSAVAHGDRLSSDWQGRALQADLTVPFPSAPRSRDGSGRRLGASLAPGVHRLHGHRGSGRPPWGGAWGVRPPGAAPCAASLITQERRDCPLGRLRTVRFPLGPDDATRPRSRGDGETGSCAASSGLPVLNVGFVAIRDRPGIGGRRFILRSPTTRNDPAPLPSGGFGMASGVVTPAPALRPAQQQLLQRGLRCCGMQQKTCRIKGIYRRSIAPGGVGIR